MSSILELLPVAPAQHSSLRTNGTTSAVSDLDPRGTTGTQGTATPTTTCGCRVPASVRSGSMTGVTDEGSHVDGRIARRERNVDAVLDVVLEMFGEDMMFPTIEQAAKRSGLSLRSLYRYFADPGQLVEAAITHDRQRAAELSHLSQIGKGPFAPRLDDFVSMRLRLYEAHGPIYRATVHNAAALSRVRVELERNRRLLREQFELQFAPELAALPPHRRVAAVEAGNLLTQLDSIDQLRRAQNLSTTETDAVLRDSLTTLLAHGV